MSQCNFSVPFTSSAADVVAQARSGIERAGGTFTGDAQRGTFSLSTLVGSVEGSYTISGASLNVTIAQKPMFIPCGMIESELIKRLGSANA